MKQNGRFCIASLALAATFSSSVAAFAQATKLTDAALAEPTRLVIEAEEMKGVAQNKFGPGKGWQVGRWGTDLYQNMVFGGVWASRLRVAMTDATSTPAKAYSDITVPAAGTYKVWAKYEAPPFFNYAFGLRIQSLPDNKTVFDKTYGLRDSAKHFSFTDKLQKGDLYWTWGIDHDAAEGYQATLKKGRYRVTLYKTANPAPAAPRSVDAILITSDLAEISSPRMPRYPLLDELRRANHVYFRFRNLSQQSGRVAWNHWNHRYPDFYAPSYRELVKFYDASGQQVVPEGGNEKAKGDWPQPLAAGAASVWYDLGPTMNVESTSPFTVSLLPEGAKAGASSLPVGVDIALAPDAKKIVKSFQLGADENALNFLVQPDLFRKEGVEYTKKTTEIYADVARALNATPRLGPVPQRLRVFASTGSPAPGVETAKEFDLAQQFRLALGLNAFQSNQTNKEYLDKVTAWRKQAGAPIVEHSLAYQHSQEPAKIAEMVKKNDVAKYFYYLSFGDEIGLPSVDVNDKSKVAAFQEYVKAQGETPQTLGVAGWEQVKPLNTLSADVAVKIGVLPEQTPATDATTNKLKRLYWYSTQFRMQQGIADFAQKTQEFKTLLGDDVETTANLGSMHPFFWMQQASFIEAFKHKAMSLAWSEDYTFTQPEASRLVADFEASYLRKGASYHDTPMQFYCMPHWPGNSAENLLQNAVLLWANNVKDLDWFDADPDVWSTENYIAYRGGLPMWRMLRTVSGMAGLIEDDLLPARPVSTPVAMLLSESSDLWELNGNSQNAVEPGSAESNVSQEERKNLWYALRHAGYRVDFVTEDDVKEGLLKNYKVLYVCGQNLQRSAADKLKQWVQNGGVLYATAGAARKDEFDEPLTTLDEVLGRGIAQSYQRYRGPLRAKLELLFLKPLDTVKIGAQSLDVLASKETFAAAPGAQVLATYASDGSPAWVQNSFGKGSAFYTGALPGEAFVQKALPVVPMGKGGPESNSSHFEPVNFNATAREMILRPLRDAKLAPDTSTPQRGVVMGRLSSPRSTMVPVVNLAEQHDGVLKNVPITLTGIAQKPAKVWSCFHKDGVPFTYNDGTLTLTLPTLQAADIIVLSNR
jgi:hypothetical protein